MISRDALAPAVMDDFFCEKKKAIFQWLADQSYSGNSLFKASDVKVKFLSTSSVLVDEIIAVLVSEGMAHIEETKRIITYKVDIPRALQVANIPEVKEDIRKPLMTSKRGNNLANLLFRTHIHHNSIFHFLLTYYRHLSHQLSSIITDASSFIAEGQENGGAVFRNKDLHVKQKIRTNKPKPLKVIDPNRKDLNEHGGVPLYEEENEEQADCGISVTSNSPNFKFEPRSISSLQTDLRVKMTGCLYKAFENDDDGTAPKGVLRNIITKEVCFRIY